MHCKQCLAAIKQTRVIEHISAYFRAVGDEEKEELEEEAKEEEQEEGGKEEQEEGQQGRQGQRGRGQ